MYRLLASLLAPFLLLTACSSQESEGEVNTNGDRGPLVGRGQESSDFEAQLIPFLADSCEKAMVAGVTEASPDGARMVLFPDGLAYESHRAFYETSEGEIGLVFSLDSFLVCDAHLRIANYLDQNGGSGKADFPYEIEALGAGKFTAALKGDREGPRTYVIRAGLVTQLILVDGTELSIAYGQYLPEDLANLENLVKTLYG